MKIIRLSSVSRFDQCLDLFHRSSRVITRASLTSPLPRSFRSLRCAAIMKMTPLTAARCSLLNFK